MARNKVDRRVIARSHSHETVIQALNQLRTFRKRARDPSLLELLDKAISCLGKAAEADLLCLKCTAENNLREAIDYINDVRLCCSTKSPTERRLDAMINRLGDSLTMRSMLRVGNIEGIVLEGVTSGGVKVFRRAARRTKSKIDRLQEEIRELEHQLAEVTHLADGMDWFLQQTEPRPKRVRK